MDEMQTRLTKCFAAVFPTLTEGAIQQASMDTVMGWDSVASVTLFATVEEEFGIELDLQDLAGLTSFALVLSHLRRIGAGRGAGAV